MRALFRGSWPVIIGGSHRSGTSLLRRLLNGHPEIFCPSEIKFHLDLLGQLQSDPLTFSRLGTSISALGLEREFWLDEFGRAYVRCYVEAARRQGKKRWADKNPENSINIDHWHRLLKGRFFFVLVVRHPFDIVASMAEAQMDRVIPKSISGRAHHIRRFIDPGLQYCRQHSVRTHIVRYEDLVVSTEACLRELLSTINAPFHPIMLDALKNKHLKGVEDPKVAATKKVNSASVDRWKGEFTNAEVSQIKEILSPILLEFEYDTER